MRLKTDHFLGILMAVAVIFANTAVSWAIQIDFEEGDVEKEALLNEETLAEEPVVPSISDLEKIGREDSNKIDQDEFMARLREELNLSKSDYRQVLNSIDSTKIRLKQVQDDKMTLVGQVQNLDDMVTLTTEKLVNVIAQVVQTENEITVIYEQMEIKKTALQYQKNLLKDYIRLIYQEENAYFSLDENGEMQAFKLLLADDSVGENLQQLQYFSLLNEAGQQMVTKLYDLSNELSNYQEKLTEKNTKLTALQKQLEIERNQMAFQKDAKEKLLSVTLGQEEIYAQLLEQSLEEQEQLLIDVKNLSNAVNFIEQKMAEEGDDFDPEEYLSLLDYRTQSVLKFRMEYLGDVTLGKFMWPVEPYKGLSAYFRDQGYVGVFGVQHNAIDIPTYQGTSVRSAADGVIYTAKDNGYGYSYIIVAHADGYMTVYGHISEILVSEGDMVNKGDLIGLSGGMPGTKGAGYMTTGPHLHLEMLLNGNYVDPLESLPLEKLTEEQMENLPEKYLEKWKAAVEEIVAEPISR